MPDVNHADLYHTNDVGIHGIIGVQYPDASDRESHTNPSGEPWESAALADLPLGLVALQADDDTLWVLSGNSGVNLSWVLVGVKTIAPTVIGQLVYFGTTAGTGIKNSLVAVDGSGNMTVPDTLTVTNDALAANLKKANLAASGAPGVSDDSDDGYAVGSRWLDTTNDKEYVCTDASVGAAVWVGLVGGDVSGPVSSTNLALARWDSTGGDALLNSGITVDGSDNVENINDLAILGTFTIAGTEMPLPDTQTVVIPVDPGETIDSFIVIPYDAVLTSVSVYAAGGSAFDSSTGDVQLLVQSDPYGSPASLLLVNGTTIDPGSRTVRDTIALVASPNVSEGDLVRIGVIFPADTTPSTGGFVVVEVSYTNQ